MHLAYAFVFLALAFSIFSGDSYASIPPEGFPRFTNSVKMGLTSLSEEGVTITAFNDGFGDFTFTMGDGGTRYDVKNGIFLLTANFDENLEFLSGNLTIAGLLWPDDLPNPPPDTRINLFSAELGEADFSRLNGSNPTLGFRTLYGTFSGWAAQFASGDESVYFSGFNPNPNDGLLPFLLALANGNVMATAVTTVPVPAAVWLLASGLLPLLVSSRRKAVSAV